MNTHGLRNEVGEKEQQNVRGIFDFLEDPTYKTRKKNELLSRGLRYYKRHPLKLLKRQLEAKDLRTPHSWLPSCTGKRAR